MTSSKEDTFTSKVSKSTEVAQDCMTLVLSDLPSRTISNNCGENSSSLKKICSKSTVPVPHQASFSKTQVTLLSSLTFSSRTLKLDKDIELIKSSANGSKTNLKKESQMNKKNTNWKKLPSISIPTLNKNFIKSLWSIKSKPLIQVTNYQNQSHSTSCSRLKSVHHQISLVIWDQKLPKECSSTSINYLIIMEEDFHSLLLKSVLDSEMKSLQETLYSESENSKWLKSNISLILWIKLIKNSKTLLILNYHFTAKKFNKVWVNQNGLLSDKPLRKKLLTMKLLVISLSEFSIS